MLLSIGPFVFDLETNAEQYDIDSAEDFARKDVVGIRRPYESVGEGDEIIDIKGKLFPEKLGGAGAVDALLAIKRAATPQLLMRGDGKVLGYALVTRVHAANSYLDPHGSPRMVEMEVRCERCDPPTAGGALAGLINLLG